MQEYEVHLLIDYVPWATKVSYEQARLLLWGILSPYLKQRRTPKQLLPLPTDSIISHEEPLPDEQVDKIRKNIMKLYNNQNEGNLENIQGDKK